MARRFYFFFLKYWLSQPTAMARWGLRNWAFSFAENDSFFQFNGGLADLQANQTFSYFSSSKTVHFFVQTLNKFKVILTFCRVIIQVWKLRVLQSLRHKFRFWITLEIFESIWEFSLSLSEFELELSWINSNSVPQIATCLRLQCRKLNYRAGI